MNEDLLCSIRAAIRALKEYDAVPSRIEITREQFNRLKAHCEANGYLSHVSDKHPAWNSIFGIQIVVKD